MQACLHFPSGAKDHERSFRSCYDFDKCIRFGDAFA